MNLTCRTFPVMRLLVSVKNAKEARAAVAGGADIIDAKDPSFGAMGAVSPAALASIIGAVDGACPVSAASGDLGEPLVPSPSDLGLAFVKRGFSGLLLGDHVLQHTRNLVCVFYVDIEPLTIQYSDICMKIARQLKAVGVLLDTADKSKGSLFQIYSPDTVNAWVDQIHQAGFFAAIAGSLRAEDLLIAESTGADIAGVRGAACAGGRNGTIALERVQQLARITHHTHAHA